MKMDFSNSKKQSIFMNISYKFGNKLDLLPNLYFLSNNMRLNNQE